MLQAIRERAQGVLAWVILILITVPFALWGIQNYFNTGKEMPVAVVGDREFFQRDVNQVYEQITQNRGLDEQQIREQALDRLIRDEVLAQATSRLGIAVSDATVRAFIQSMDVFQTNGTFDKEKYKLILSAQRKSPAEFIAQVRKALEMEQYQRAVTNSGFATDRQVEQLFRLLDQERTVEYVLVSAKPTDIAISEDAIKQYYQGHIAQFQTPERVTIRFLELSLNDLAQAVHPSEEELRAFYEERKDAYSTEERRKISHILVAVPAGADDDAVSAAKEKINQAKNRIEAGETFAAVAQDLSDDTVSAKKGGDLGLITPGVMEKTFDEAAFKLGKGELSEPVRTSFGFHLITVTELEPRTTKPFAEVRDEIEKAYRLHAAENTFYQAGETLAELSYENPDSLDATAQALGLPIKEAGPFSRDQGDGIAAEPAIREAAFSEEVLDGQNSEPIELGSNRVVVLRIEKRIPAATKPLDDVRQQIVDTIRVEQAKERARKKAEVLYQALRQGQPLETLARSEGLDLKKPEPIKRTDAKTVPWPLLKALFQAPKPRGGKPTPLIVALPNGDQAVASLLAVKDGDPGAVDAKKRAAAKERLANAEGQALLGALIAELRNQADVTVAENVSEQND